MELPLQTGLYDLSKINNFFSTHYNVLNLLQYYLDKCRLYQNILQIHRNVHLNQLFGQDYKIQFLHQIQYHQINDIH